MTVQTWQHEEWSKMASCGDMKGVGGIYEMTKQKGRLFRVLVLRSHGMLPRLRTTCNKTSTAQTRTIRQRNLKAKAQECNVLEPW